MNSPINPVRLTFAAAVLVLGALGGCASVPPGPPPEVVRLQGELDRLHQDPRIATNAGDELRDADLAVSVLVTDGRHMDPAFYQHRVYVADRLVQIAEAEGLARFAEVRATDLGRERDRLALDARNHELRDARETASDALAAAAAERRAAELARSDARETRVEIDALRADLSDLQAQQTERGLVVTLGDVLFETDRAELKPGAERALDGLVRALRDDPAASVSIEGHTDSVGGRDYNIDLSLRRAETVKDYLASRGIDPGRVSARGLGADYPVASNATEAGRQQNRRVEVVVQTQVATLGRRDRIRD
jgi:outer membrane protein OmpA-like peptidoglycan-associated protein